jgi:hypothetical protein
VLEAYANPTVNVGSEIMAAVADEIEETAKEIEESKFFEEILDVIIEVQQELEAASDEDGDLVIGGVKFPAPNGVLQIAYVCPGWDERQLEPDYDAEPNPTNGTIDLTMTLDEGDIGQVVWGVAMNCRYLVPIENENFPASFDGQVAVDLGGPRPPDQDIAELPVTFVVEGTIGFDGSDFDIRQSFRVTLDNITGLELLVQVEDGTFNFFFEGDSQGLRDSVGIYSCNLEERECTSPFGSFSW